jgi:hypothetical protein
MKCDRCIAVHKLMLVVWTDLLKTYQRSLREATEASDRERFKTAIATAKQRLSEPEPSECVWRKEKVS